MSFNIRYYTAADGRHAWPLRRDSVTALIMEFNPDVLGIQEGLAHQVDALAGGLPHMNWIGAGRDDGRSAGEFAAVFYKKNRLELIDSGNFWLSQNPDSAGSWGWDAACRRVTTWGHFKDIQTNKEFCLFNTHLDHQGKRARRESINLLRQKINRIDRELPVILCGDFNFTAEDTLYQRILDPAGMVHGLRDARAAADSVAGPSWTFHGFGRMIPGVRLDYIFVDAGIRVKSFRSFFRPGDIFPSDHLPVIGHLQLP
jgi:endonuclease/exonuclease/phosphatase family metal-dependent hydrolase